MHRRGTQAQELPDEYIAAVMEMSTDQFETFLTRIMETINGTMRNPNIPGTVGKKSFTETMKKDIERLDTKQFKDWKQA